MQVALIPPVADLDLWRKQSDMHLALNHLMTDLDYSRFMQKVGNAGEWITLDNSAHEFQSGQKIEDLLVNAIAIQAREMVIPDVLFHAMYTVEAGRDAFRFLSKSDLFKACSPTPRLMIVPQGRDVGDWAWCLSQLVETAEAWGFGGLLSVGLSKDYAKYPGFPGGLNHLIHQHLLPLYASKKIETHLLGWPCTWDLIDLSRKYPCLRSTDSAKPFIYAFEGVTLNHNQVPRYIRRPEGYFDMALEDDMIQVAQMNVTAFKLASRGVKQREDEGSLVTGA
jgi:hypothetical protein